jgi:hypothetical protein
LSIGPFAGSRCPGYRVSVISVGGVRVLRITDQRIGDMVLTGREQAIRWADSVRRDIEKGYLA